MTKARVVSPWRASYDPALKVAAGDRVEPGGTDPDNPGWRWCVDAYGLGGWLPVAVVRDDRAVAAFDTCELSVAGGEEVEILSRLSGWSLCRLGDDQEGWLPDDCLLIEASRSSNAETR